MTKRMKTKIFRDVKKMKLQESDLMCFKYSKEGLRKRVNGFGPIVERYRYYKVWIDTDLFFHPNGLHGPAHIQRVLMLTILISQLCELSEEQEKILVFCSLYHDIGRHHDGVDPFHGAASATKMKKLKHKMNLSSGDELEIASMIIQHHSVDDAHAIKEHKNLRNFWNPGDYQQLQRLFPLFKDADNLDRVRINDLDERYLRDEESTRLSSLAMEMFVYHQKQPDLTYFFK